MAGQGFEDFSESIESIDDLMVSGVLKDHSKELKRLKKPLLAHLACMANTLAIQAICREIALEVPAVRHRLENLTLPEHPVLFNTPGTRAVLRHYWDSTISHVLKSDSPSE